MTVRTAAKRHHCQHQYGESSVPRRSWVQQYQSPRDLPAFPVLAGVASKPACWSQLVKGINSCIPRCVAQNGNNDDSATRQTFDATTKKKNLHFAHTEPRFNNGRHADLADQTDRTGEQPLPTLERVIQYPIRLLSRAVASVVHKLSK